MCSRRPPPLSPPLLVVLAGAHPALRTPTENMAILKANLCAMTFSIASHRPSCRTCRNDAENRRSERSIKTTKRISFKTIRQHTPHLMPRGRYRQQLGYTVAILSCTDLISHHFPVQQGTITNSPGTGRSLLLIIDENYFLTQPPAVHLNGEVTVWILICSQVGSNNTSPNQNETSPPTDLSQCDSPSSYICRG